MKEVSSYIVRLNEVLGEIGAQASFLSNRMVEVKYRSAKCKLFFDYKNILNQTGFRCKFNSYSTTEGLNVDADSEYIDHCRFVAVMADSKELRERVCAILEETLHK